MRPRRRGSSREIGPFHPGRVVLEDGRLGRAWSRWILLGVEVKEGGGGLRLVGESALTPVKI